MAGSSHYDEEEQLTGLATMVEENLEAPFTTAVLGITVTVTGVTHDLPLPEPVLVENSAASTGLGFHAVRQHSLISPASLAWRWNRVTGPGNAMTSGLSSGARSPMPFPWWLRPVL
jgi:hypothetical protein